MESNWLKNRVADGAPNFQVLKVVAKNCVPEMWMDEAQTTYSDPGLWGIDLDPSTSSAPRLRLVDPHLWHGIFCNDFKAWKLGTSSATRFFSQSLSMCPGSVDCALTLDNPNL